MPEKVSRHWSALLRLGIVYTEGIDADVLYALVLVGTVAAVTLCVCYLIDLFHTGEHLPEGSILAVKVGRILMHDEELGACAVGHHAAGHGKDSSGVLKLIFKAIIGKFPLDAVAGTSHAGAGGISALYHKSGNDTVEDDAVIKALIDKAYEVIDGIGGDVGIELGGDDCAIFHLYGYDGVLIFHFLIWSGASIVPDPSFLPLRTGAFFSALSVISETAKADRILALPAIHISADEIR